MRKSILYIVVMLLLFPVSSLLLENGSSSDGGPDGFGYEYVDSEDPKPKVEFDYIDIKQDEDVIGWDTGDYYAIVTASLGFNFKYYGTTYSDIHISTYGAMSFVSNSGSSYRNWGDKDIPSTRSPVGVMAPYWTYNNCYTQNSDRLFTLQTEIDGEKAFIVEWNPSRGGRFQAILYEGGMIKFQIHSVPRTPVGSAATMGIEKPDGSTGIGYLDYHYPSSDEFTLPFAIAFVLDDIDITDVELFNGDGRRGETVYAGSKPYLFQVRSRHSGGGNKIISVMLELGSRLGQENIKLLYVHENRTFAQLTGIHHLRLVQEDCSWEKVGNRLTVEFAVDFSLEYPSDEMRNVTAKTTGRSAVPETREGGEIYWVETEVEWDPEDLHVIRMSDQRPLVDGDYVAGNEVLRFTGFRVFYENSDVQPPSSLFKINIEDNYETSKTAYIQQGSTLDITWTSVDQTTQMIWSFETEGFPQFSLISPPFDYSLRIDTDSPEEVPEIRTYADSLDEGSTLYDNDGEIIVEWEHAQDGSSGIGSYIVRAESDGFSIDKQVEDDTNSTHLGENLATRIPEGEVNISITPVDDVGNIGSPTWMMFTVDLTGPTYQIVNPLPGEWAKSTTPDVTIRVRDTLTGIYGQSLEYRVSRDGGYEFDEWKSFYYFGSDNQVDKMIEPNLHEGKDNLIEVRSTDLAGSELTTSDPFNIWVDSKSPSISMSEPRVDENGTTMQWLRDTRERMRIKVHDFKGAGIDPSRLYYRISTDGGETYSAEIPLEGEGYNNSQGYLEYAFSISSSDWKQGEDNILMVEAYDMVGRNTTVKYRIRFDVEPTYSIISPRPSQKLYDNESIPFNIDVMDPDGNEDITVTWMSNVDGLIGTGTSLESQLSPGEHIIQVTVDDMVHTVKEIITVTVKASILEDPRYKDSDGDGMNDSYERRFGLNPLADDADNDLDGDGYSNKDEFYAGTDPSDDSIYPGSELVEENFPFVPLIVLIISLFAFIVAGTLLVKEANKAKVNQNSMRAAPPMQSVRYDTGSSNSPDPALSSLPPPGR